jgi:hypothetical protein
MYITKLIVAFCNSANTSKKMVNTKKCASCRYNSREVIDSSYFKNEAVSAQNTKLQHCSGETETGVLSRIKETPSFLCSYELVQHWGKN